jgi:hypothetical protein
MVFNIDIIKNLIQDNKIQWRGHMLARMQQRGILLNDVLQCILNGEIIEYYPTDYPYPSCLVLGFIDNIKVLHVVCAMGEDNIWMITSYYPDKEEWSEDFRKRRG